MPSLARSFLCTLSVRDCTLNIPKSVGFLTIFFTPRKWPLLCTAYLVKLRKIEKTKTMCKERNKDISTR